MLLSPKEVAEHCGLNKKAIYAAVEDGELRAYKLRSRIRIHPADLDAWLNEHRTT